MKKRILLLEDNSEVREFYADFLSKNFEVETVGDGEEGLEKLRKASPQYDLILLDIMMPKMDGVSFLKTKNQDPKLSNVPVVVLSNLGQDDVLKACFGLGITFYILKAETTPDEVEKVVHQALDNVK